MVMELHALHKLQGGGGGLSHSQNTVLQLKWTQSTHAQVQPHASICLPRRGGACMSKADSLIKMTSESAAQGVWEVHACKN